MTTSMKRVKENIPDDTFETEKGNKESSKQSSGILPYVMDDLTPELIEEARTMLHETDEVRSRSLRELRELIKGETKLRTPTDDNFLLAFLRARKFDVKRAFKLLKNYWSFRSEFRSIYDETDSQSVRELIMRNFLGLLPFRDKNGCAVFLIKVGQWDPEQDSYDDLFRTVSALLTYCIKYPATQVAGFRFIVDIRELSWKQLKYVTPSNILLIVRSTQFCFPARFKAVHILSDNKIFYWFWSIVYPLLTPKLRKRVKFHMEEEDTKALLEFIDPSVLPDELGGQGGPFENSKWSDMFEKNEEEIMGMLNYGYED